MINQVSQYGKMCLVVADVSFPLSNLVGDLINQALWCILHVTRIAKLLFSAIKKLAEFCDLFFYASNLF